MGAYADNLLKRIQGRMEARKPKPVDPKAERLRAVAILRDGRVFERGFKSHWELRAALNPELMDYTQTIHGDVDGFITTSDRFVDRTEAQEVAFKAGQIHSMMRRPMLSSDINW